MSASHSNVAQVRRFLRCVRRAVSHLYLSVRTAEFLVILSLASRKQRSGISWHTCLVLWCSSQSRPVYYQDQVIKQFKSSTAKLKACHFGTMTDPFNVSEVCFGSRRHPECALALFLSVACSISPLYQCWYYFLVQPSWTNELRTRFSHYFQTFTRLFWRHKHSRIEVVSFADISHL